MSENGLDYVIALAQKMAASRGWDEGSEHLQPKAVPVKDMVGELMNPSHDFSVELQGTLWSDLDSKSRKFTLLASPLGNLFEFSIEGKGPYSNFDVFSTPWSDPKKRASLGHFTYIPTSNIQGPAVMVFYQRLQIWGGINQPYSDGLSPTDAWYLPVGLVVVRCSAIDGSRFTDMIFDQLGRYLIFYRHVIGDEIVLELVVSQAKRIQNPKNRPLIKSYNF